MKVSSVANVHSQCPQLINFIGIAHDFYSPSTNILTPLLVSEYIEVRLLNALDLNVSLAGLHSEAAVRAGEPAKA